MPFCEGLVKPVRKVKESAARMEKIPYTMVLHNHLDGADTRFATMSGPLVKDPLEKFLGVIRIGTYQAASEDSRWGYEPVLDSWPDVDTESVSIDYRSSDEGSKYQDHPYYQKHNEVVSVLLRNLTGYKIVYGTRIMYD